MITILGASGFVGSNILSSLTNQNIEFFAPGRNENLSGKFLGDVIYCIGMTADFRTKPFETVESHVCKLSSVLKDCSFDSLTYLSSTRVYLKSITNTTHLTETDNIIINAQDPFDLFAASKITGELLALNSGRGNIKVVRLSNVFGADLLSQNFITSIIKDALYNKKVEVFTTPDSSKDYIGIKDVCTALIQLATKPITGIYNLCYGQNTSNEDILNRIQELTGADIKYSPKAQKVIFKEIGNLKLLEETGFTPTTNLIQSLPEVIATYKSTSNGTFFNKD